MENYNFDNDFEFNDESDNLNQDEEPFFSQDELKDLFSEQQKINDSKKIYEKISGFIEEKENNIIKAEDVQNNVTQFELESILGYDDEKRKQDFYVPSANTIIEEKSNQELFNDYLRYPKIAGKKSISDDSSIIPQERVEDTKKIIDIKDEEPDIEGHHTSIEIIRDQFEEIESIIVHCKCGEKTVIKFDYETDVSDDEFITSKTMINPFSVEEIQLKINNED